jgi:uncharacterized protein YyaL (SSP411 family)
MFLTPDQRPFFGGTYFPSSAGRGMPAFRDVLGRVADYFAGHADEIGAQNDQLSLAFQQLVPDKVAADTRLDAAPLANARLALEKSFDSRFGGFGRAPKFPQPGAVERLLRWWRSTSDEPAPDLQSLFMATLTLTRMAEGGIYDQLGGGFARYSVDDFWMIPHFEKMLYDNAQLLALYARASLATGESLFARVTHETADWLLRDMHAAAGGFYSSLDADSEGHEGRFYAWHADEARALLTPQEYGLVAQRFGLDQPANFEDRWHLHAQVAEDSLTVPPGISAAAELQSARRKLLAARNLRIWPARDEKILTSWNALTIKGLAIAGRVLQREDLIDAATTAVDFLRRTLWRDGRLLATYKDGRAHLAAYLDDYAFLADALLELLQTRWRSSDLQFARELLEVVLDKFADHEAGGFFFTASDHEALIHRSKSFGDDALPSGNGIAAAVLGRMGCLLGETRYLQAAEQTLRAAVPLMLEHPRSHMSMLNALEDWLAPTQVLILRGKPADMRHWTRELGALYAPTLMTFAIPDGEDGLPPALADKSMGAATTAYLCTGTTCSAPMTELPALALRLKESRRPA